MSRRPGGRSRPRVRIDQGAGWAQATNHANPRESDFFLWEHSRRFVCFVVKTVIDRTIASRIQTLKGTLKNPMLNTFHGDAHKSRFSNALIIMELRART